MHPQVLHVRDAAPDLADQEMMRKDLPGVLDEDTQDVVLARRQLDLAVADADDPPHEIDRKVAGLEDRPFPCCFSLCRNARRMRAISSIVPKGFVT